jgi:hypothetical protein
MYDSASAGRLAHVADAHNLENSSERVAVSEPARAGDGCMELRSVFPPVVDSDVLAYGWPVRR